MLPIFAHYTLLISSSFAHIFQAETANNSSPIWVIIFILLLMVLLFWWGMTRNNIPEEKAEEAHVDHIQADADTILSSDVGQEPQATAVAPLPLDSPTEPDDLQRIEGIGPKISSILTAAGIVTFAQLANTDVAQLNKIVREDAGIRIANPTSWPQQAQLAAAGDWAGLQTLQDRLIAGRH